MASITTKQYHNSPVIKRWVCGLLFADSLESRGTLGVRV